MNYRSDDKRGMLSHPTPYAKTDHAETAAITLLRTLLDHPYIKCHLSERDKTPNYDGTIELVNNLLEPTGEIKVQVKRLNGACAKAS